MANIHLFLAITFSAIIYPSFSKDCCPDPNKNLPQCGSQVNTLYVESSTNTSMLIDSLLDAYSTWNDSVRLGFNSYFNQIRTVVYDNSLSGTSKVERLITIFKNYNRNNKASQMILWNVCITEWNGDIDYFINCETYASSSTTTLPTNECSATTITPNTMTTTIATITTTAPVCMNGVGSSCLAFDRADTVNYREGTESPISTSACTTAPISKSCYNSHTEDESINVKDGPVPSRVKVTTGSAFCDPTQTCVCVENGECFTVVADNNCVEVGLDFYPYCECLPAGGTECHTYLSITQDLIYDPSCAGFSLTGDMGTNHDGFSEFTSPGVGPPLGKNSIYLKAVSVSCNGCAPIKGNTCPN